MDEETTNGNFMSPTKCNDHTSFREADAKPMQDKFNLLKSHEKYQKRKGVIDEGKEYEYMMCALYALRFCSNEDVEDFKMTTNNEKCGDFDDIELKVIFRNKSSASFMFQLKHRYQNEKVTQQMLTKQIVNSKKSKFYVKQYLESIAKLTQNDKTKPENRKFILLTNGEIAIQNGEKLTLTDKKINHDLAVINRSNDLELKNLIANVEQNKERNCCFQFDSNTENGIFSKEVTQNFYMLHQQHNLSSVKVDVDLLLKKIVDCDIFNSFEQFIRNWWADNYVLTKHLVISKLTELALSSYILPISGIKCNEKTELLEAAIMSFKLSIVKSNDKGIVTNIWKAANDDNNLGAVSSTSAEILDECKDVIQQSKVLWCNKKAPLVVKVDDKNKLTVKKVLQLLKNDNFGPILLVGEISEEIPCNNVFCCLTDLLQTCREKPFCIKIMEDFKISIQGKNALSLKELLNFEKEFGKIIKSEHLLEITQTNHLVIGQKNEEIPKLHIPRMLSSYVATIDTISEISEQKINVIVIIYKNINNLANIKASNMNECFTKEAGKRTLNNILLSKNFSYLDFTKVCNQFKKQNIYIFLQIDNTDYALVMKRGSLLASIEKDNCRKNFTETSITTQFSNFTNVFCAPPGMGKSRLMKVLSHYCSRDCRTININLIDYNNFLSTNPDFECIKSRFINTNKHKDANILQNLKKVLLLDGLDELDSKYVDLILDFVKTISSEGTIVWLSSRENLRDKICEKLNVIPIEIEQLNEKQQKEYIQHKLCKKYKNEEIDKIIEAIKNSSDIANSKDLLGIPLQLHIITEMFLNDDQAFNNLNKDNIFVLTKMYKLFFDGKIKSHFEKLDICASQSTQLGITSEELLKSYELVALKSVLDKNDFIKLGLNYDSQEEFINRIKKEGDKFGIIRTINNSGNVIFDHQTYAEYFACSYLRKNKEKIILIKEILFTQKYDNLRKFLDIMLAENRPLHLAVIYKNEEQFYKNCDTDILKKDEGGRTILHLLCIYGEKFTHSFINAVTNRFKNYWSSLTTGPQQILADKICVNSLFNNDQTNFEMVAKTLQCKKIVDVRDEILGLDALEYALFSKNLTAIEYVLRTKVCDFSKIKKILYKSYDLLALNLLAIVGGWYGLMGEMIKDKKLITEIDGWSILHFASIIEQNEHIIRLLIDHGFDLNKRDANGETILHLVCRIGNISNLKTLIEKRTNNRILNFANRNFLKLNQGCNLNARTKNGETALHLACFEGHLDVVKLLIKEGADPHLLDNDNKNVLHYACDSWEPNLKMLQFLLSNGVDLNSKTKNGQTALHLACYNGHLEVVKFLLDEKADEHVLDNDNKNLLHCACESWEANMEIVQLLLNRGVDLNGKTRKGQTALHLACYEGVFQIVKLLTKNEADVNCLDNENKNPLHYACESWKENLKLVKLLIDLGVNINVKSRKGQNALHLAFFEGHLEIVKYLIKHGADVNVLDDDNKNILHHVCESNEGNLKIVALLIEHSVDLNAKTKFGQTALHLACLEKHFEIVKFLIKKGADLNILDNNSKNILHYVCESEQVLDVVQLLLDHGIDLNVKTEKGETALHLAWYNEHLDIVKLLIKNKVDVNIVENKGKSLLHYVCEASKPNLEILQLLFDHGADLNAKTENGKAALHLAFHNEHPKIVNFLIQKGANVNIADNVNKTILHYVCEAWKENLKLVQLLHNNGADLNAITVYGQTALHLACYKGHCEIVEFLLEKGADAHTSDIDEKTSLHYACESEKQNLEIVKLLLSHEVDLNAKTINGRTPLRLARSRGHRKIVDLLIKEGANNSSKFLKVTKFWKK